VTAVVIGVDSSAGIYLVRHVPALKQ